jgi:hypothetical protein
MIIYVSATSWMRNIRDAATDLLINDTQPGRCVLAPQFHAICG